MNICSMFLNVVGVSVGVVSVGAPAALEDPPAAAAEQAATPSVAAKPWLGGSSGSLSPSRDEGGDDDIMLWGAVVES